MADDGFVASRACDAARAWLALVAGLPRRSTESAAQQSWTGPQRLSVCVLEIWRGVDVAFRQPAVTAAFDRKKVPTTDARLAARGLLLQPLERPQLGVDVRSIVGLTTLRFFGEDARLVHAVEGGADALVLVEQDDERDIAVILGQRQTAQAAMDLPDGFAAPDGCVVLGIRDRSGAFVGEIAMSRRRDSWSVALPPTTMAELRSNGGRDGSSGDRAPMPPRPPIDALSAAADPPPRE